MHGLMREGWRKPVPYSTTFNPAHNPVGGFALAIRQQVTTQPRPHGGLGTNETSSLTRRWGFFVSGLWVRLLTQAVFSLVELEAVDRVN